MATEVIGACARRDIVSVSVARAFGRYGGGSPLALTP
jgi:hypothetical protein